MTSAIVLLGTPGVGKTPALIAMTMMAMGRFHIRRLGLCGVKPGWQRAKSLENFRHRVSQVQEALFLHDPSRSKIDVADLKSFVTVDEDGTCEGRYNEARLVRNRMRAVASNDIGADPPADTASATTLSPDAFFALIEPLFQGDNLKDKMAVMKRAIFFVVTGSGLFIRFPSEKHDAIIHRVVVDNVHQDLLAAKDKAVYGQYKTGILTYGQDYEKEVGQEQEMIDASMAKLSSFERVHGYVHHANAETQKWLTPVRHLPSSSESSDHEEPSRSARGLPPVFPPIGTADTPTRFGAPFVYPSAEKKRRIREKTSSSAFPVSSAAEIYMPQCLEEVSQVENLPHHDHASEVMDPANDDGALHTSCAVPCC